MADENTQTTQNTAQTAQPVVAPAVANPAPATPVAPDAPVAVPAPIVQPAPQAPVAVAPVPQAPVATPASAQPASGLSGLGIGSLKGALDSAKGAVNTAKNAAGQGTSGFSKLTGTLSSIGGNITGAVTGKCDCPEVKAEVWDKKKVTLHKTFYKTFSTRAFGFHFSDAIDKNRGMIEIKVKDYKSPANPMILDTNGLFLSTLYIEVEGANPKDPKVVSFDKEFYCKTTKNKSKKDLKQDLVALEQEMGKKPAEVYFWFVTCAKCDAGKEIKTVIMAA